MISASFPVLLLLPLYAALRLTAADSVPASRNLPGTGYPRIAPDLSVTFHLKAPEAKLVKLEGGAGLVKEPLAMTKGGDGIWYVTTPPTVPGFHYYWFTVDGLRVNDPASYAWFGWARETSGIEVPEAGVDFYDVKQEVPHGEVRDRRYFSKLTGKLQSYFLRVEDFRPAMPPMRRNGGMADGYFGDALPS